MYGLHAAIIGQGGILWWLWKGEAERRLRSVAGSWARLTVCILVVAGGVTHLPDRYTLRRLRWRLAGGDGKFRERLLDNWACCWTS